MKSTRVIGLIASLLLTACNAAPQLPAQSLIRHQTVQQAARTAEALFPVQQGFRWEYAVTVAPVMDPYAEDKGSYSLEIEKSSSGPAGSVIELRGVSGFSGTASFPTLVQSPAGIRLQDMTFVGLGADEVKGISLDFVRTPLQPGMRWEDENWIGKVIALETVTVPAGTFKAWHIDVIGTYDREYTAVGDYWIAPGMGIVKSQYSIPGFHVGMELSYGGLRKGPARR